MRRTLRCWFNHVPHRRSNLNPNLIQIQNGTFYRRHPTPNETDSSSNPPLFPSLTITLPAPTPPTASRTDQHWAVIGPHATTFLEILQGKYICLPPTARTYPYLSSDEIARKDHRLRTPSRAIQHVGFNGGKKSGASSGIRGAYLSARYESRREDTDWSVLQYLTGNTELNPSEEQQHEHRHDNDDGLLARVVKDLRLENLISMPVSRLSNGQTRRSRIAKTLLGRPELLLLDEPFMGLDPPTLTTLSPILRDLAYKFSPLLLLALRPQDPIPDWITHLAILGRNYQVALQGRKAPVLFALHRWTDDPLDPEFGEKFTAKYGPPPTDVGSTLTANGIVHHAHYHSSPPPPTSTDSPITQPRKLGEPLIELNNITVSYGPRCVLGHPHALNLIVSQGTRLALLGPNGSGKTTLISLLTSDHPHSYSLPIKFFRRTRLPQVGVPGLSLWEIQSRIGHSSPEVHAFFPRHLSIRRSLESAWAETYLSEAAVTEKSSAVIDATLVWWAPELSQSGSIDDLSWAKSQTFGELDFGSQRLLLLLRALIKPPDIIVLDEAFSGFSAEVREKAMLWLEHGQTRKLTEHGRKESGIEELLFHGLNDTQALIVVSHVREEVPDVVDEWIRLPGEEERERNLGMRRGWCGRGGIGRGTAETWNRIWQDIS